MQGAATHVMFVCLVEDGNEANPAPRRALQGCGPQARWVGALLTYHLGYG
jgi:hypothetical protein